MHEANFTEQIVSSIVSELEKYPRYKPQRVKVSVGEMLHLDAESVRLHCELITRGTKLEGVELELEEIGAQILCRACKCQGKVIDHHFLKCGNCGSFDVELVKGNEILIDSVEPETFPKNVS